MVTTMYNILEEKTRQLKSVNGYEIWKCWRGKNVYYDVYEEGDNDWVLDVFRTLEEARAYCRSL